MAEYKGFNIEGDGTYGYKNIKSIGKGSIPMELRGVWTSETYARRAIDSLISAKESPNEAERRT